VKYLVDTDRAADWLKGRPDALDLLQLLAPDGLAISLISLGELYEGIYFGGDPIAGERGLRSFLRFVDVLPLNRSIVKRFAQIRGELRRQGQLIGDPDLLIAATALHHDLFIVTRNTRHFARVPGISLHQSGES
jgi:predicted nucleic acid-binding protein